MFSVIWQKYCVYRLNVKCTIYFVFFAARTEKKNMQTLNDLVVKRFEHFFFCNLFVILIYNKITFIHGAVGKVLMIFYVLLFVQQLLDYFRTIFLTVLDRFTTSIHFVRRKTYISRRKKNSFHETLYRKLPEYRVFLTYDPKYSCIPYHARYYTHKTYIYIPYMRQPGNDQPCRKQLCENLCESSRCFLLN